MRTSIDNFDLEASIDQLQQALKSVGEDNKKK